MSNTYLKPGEMSLEELIEDIPDGIYLKGSRGGQVDTGKGIFQFNAAEGFKIENGELTIKFETDNKIDKKELEEYYFMKKVSNAIKSFASKLNLKYNVLFNENKWTEIL